MKASHYWNTLPTQEYTQDHVGISGREDKEPNTPCANLRFRNSAKDIGSNHYLVCTTIKLRLKTKPKEKKSARVKYNTTKLNMKSSGRLLPST